MDITTAALITVSYWIGMRAGYQLHEPCEHHEKYVLTKENVNKNEKEDPLLKKDLINARAR